MILALTFILFLTIFLIIVNFFAILFRLTGMPIDKAKFQVISLLTSTGFTTKESELIVQHPIRRKLASWLMIISYISTAVLISFIIGIISNSLSDAKSLGFTAIIIVTFFIIVYFIVRSSLLDKVEYFIEEVISKSKRWNEIIINSPIDIGFHHKKGYGIYEIFIGKDSKFIGKSIIESNLKSLEIQVLSIDKGDELINFPTPDSIFELTDRITIYGNVKNINRTFKQVSYKNRLN